MFALSRFFLYLTVFFVALVTPSTLFPFIVGKYAWFRTMTDFALISFLLGLVFDANADLYVSRLKNIFRSPIVIAVTVFTVAFLLAGVFGIDPLFSFWSNFERGEGGIQIIHLYLFFLLLVTLFLKKEYWKRIFWLSMIAALLMIGYGIGAGLKYVDADTRTSTDGVIEYIGTGGPWYQTFEKFIGSSFQSDGYRFSGSIGNPAYVAAYLVFALFYAANLLLEEKRPFRSWRFWLVVALCIIFSVFFYLAATRGALLGLIAGMVAFLVYVGYSVKKLRPWTIACGILVIIGLSLLVGFRNEPIIQNLPGARLFDISFTARTFGDRLTMWGIAWDGWKDRPIFGYGPENFLYVFDTHFNPSYFNPAEGFGAWFDRAHSVVFDYLAETGAVGLLSYLGIFVSIYGVMFFYRRKYGEESGGYRSVFGGALLFALPVAYFVQGFVLFDVLIIYFNLFLFFAFATHKLTASLQK